MVVNWTLTNLLRRTYLIHDLQYLIQIFVLLHLITYRPPHRRFTHYSVNHSSSLDQSLFQNLFIVYGLFDTGAQGSNFVSRKLYNQLPPATTALSKLVDRVVRLGDSSSFSVLLEIPLTVSRYPRIQSCS